MLQNHLILASTRLLYGVLYSDDALPKMKTSNIKLPKITKKTHQCKRDKKYSQTFSAFSILMELSLLSLVMRPIFILRVSMASPAHGVVISVILLAHTRSCWLTLELARVLSIFSLSSLSRFSHLAD